MELSSSRKIKINLSDYDFQKDIENRQQMAQFSTFDIQVLEEILYSPLKISITELAQNLDSTVSELHPVLKKLNRIGLLSVEGDQVFVDKEMRKYFEFYILKFDDDFKPDMEFLQGLLKKVPIHLLPIWYSLPRTSNNIFESIVEKYLATPSVYQKHLEEMGTHQSFYAEMIEDVFSSSGLRVQAQDLCEKYSLSREEFEKHMLFLEFSFCLCISYTQIGDEWKEVVTPFHEWKQYLKFLRVASLSPISDSEQILKNQKGDFSFIRNLISLLENLDENQGDLSNHEKWCSILNLDLPMIQNLIEKVIRLKFVDDENTLTPIAKDWLSMDLANKSIFLYRHPANRVLPQDFSLDVFCEKNIRELERSLKPSVHAGWVYFDDFIKGAIIPFRDYPGIHLDRKGKTWTYQLPNYLDSENDWIHGMIFHWFCELGMLQTGTHEGKDCFCVTSFGQTFLES